MLTKEKLLAFVGEKFKDKVDKAGCSYIQHLFRVADAAFNMCYFREETSGLLHDIFEDTSNKLYRIGLLHDIFEDTDTSVEELREYVDEEIIDAVKILTRHPYNKKSIPTQRDTYMEYINSIIESGNILAIMVKLCDLKDNMDITRFDNFNNVSIDLLKRYHRAYMRLLYSLE